jgi:NAD(P)H-flavin reductase
MEQPRIDATTVDKRSSLAVRLRMEDSQPLAVGHPPAADLYLPKVAVLDEVQPEIPEVRTFFWHFEDPVEQEAFRRFRPGQFAQVSLLGVGEFPASLPPSPSEDRTFFTIRQVGSCTSALFALRPGDKFGVRGPYGNGFPMEQYYGKNLVFVAGGIGLIPLRSCIVYALEHRSRFQRIQIFHGAKTPPELMYTAKLKEWGETDDVECHIAVDKATGGWQGHVGVVGSLFKKRGVQVPVDNTVAFVCGPPIMFRFVIQDLLEMGFKEQAIVSTLERYMKCGVGKCGHCCIGVAYVCADGPVFTYEQIRHLGEII